MTETPITKPWETEPPFALRDRVMLSSAVAAGNESQWLSDVRVSLRVVQWMWLSVVTQANMSALSDKPGDVLQLGV